MDIENSKLQLKITIGQNIRKLRLANKLTIDELSEYLGISPSFLGIVERGKRGLCLQKLLKLTKLFNVSLDEIVLSENQNEMSEEENLLEMITFMARKLSYSEQERLVTIIKAAFPLWYEDN